MLMLSNDYILGLVDGEGSFTAYIRDPNSKKKVKRRVVAEPRFYVKLQEGDKKILYELKKFFKCGNVYFQRDKRENHKHCYRYEVANRKQLTEIIIPFFRKNKLKIDSRIRDFDIFTEIMKRMKKGEHLTANGLRELYLLKQKMH